LDLLSRPYGLQDNLQPWYGHGILFSRQYVPSAIDTIACRMFG
jgi:hypothetical protein